MAATSGKKRLQGAIIIKKNEIVEGGHHGGAWKVAYADFVTAMMAFFLLMWLLNATTEDQRKGLADYFSPNNVMSHSSSGVGQPFGGHTAFDEGSLVSDRGKVDVTIGKKPVLDQVEDGEDPVYTEYHRAPKGDGVGVGPLKDNDYADDDDDAPRGQPGTERAAGPGGSLTQAVRTQSETRADGKGTATVPQPGAGNPVAGQAGMAAGMAPGMAPGAAQQRVAAQEAAQIGGASTTASAPQDKPADAALSARQAAAMQAVAAAQQEKAAFEKAASDIRQAMQADPALADLAKQLAIDITPNGLRIQIMDEIKLPMFSSGSSSPNDRARALVQKVVPILNKLNEPISVAGYTDATPFPGPDRTNWELSAERANATRRMLVDNGLPETRIQSVTGHADRDLLLPKDPFAAANRRIAILVQRQAPMPLPAAKR
jgi:chemotaxis protein MotB